MSAPSGQGIFTKWQPHYAEKRIATFPVGTDKKPQIKRWNQLGLSGSAKLARRFTEANAFGFQPGPRSRVTVLDIDSQDEAILADALADHGDTPFIVRTGGGYHAYYRHGGERRHIRNHMQTSRLTFSAAGLSSRPLHCRQRVAMRLFVES